jgi:hypothetical protein
MNKYFKCSLDNPALCKLLHKMGYKRIASVAAQSSSQTMITAMWKRPNQATTPDRARSYALAASGNRFEPLQEKEDIDDSTLSSSTKQIDNMMVESVGDSILNGEEMHGGSQNGDLSTVGDTHEDNETQVTQETSMGVKTMDSSLGISDEETTISGIDKGTREDAKGKSNPISPMQVDKISEPPKMVRTTGGLAEGLDRAGTTSATPKTRNPATNRGGKVTRGGGIAPSSGNIETGGKNRPTAIPIPTGATGAVKALDKPPKGKKKNKR